MRFCHPKYARLYLCNLILLRILNGPDILFADRLGKNIHGRDHRVPRFEMKAQRLFRIFFGRTLKYLLQYCEADFELLVAKGRIRLAMKVQIKFWQTNILEAKDAL